MKTIFFDWGGVIADDPGDDLLMQLLRGIGASAEQIQQINKTYMADFMRGKISEQEYWQKLRDVYGFSVPGSISDEFKTWSGLHANEDILALVDTLKSQGWQTAVLSNVIQPTYELLKNVGLYGKFDAIIASCEEGFAKPDSQIYKIALRRLRTSPKDAVFIDDKQRNLKPAKTMGMRVILAENPKQIMRDITTVCGIVAS